MTQREHPAKVPDDHISTKELVRQRGVDQPDPSLGALARAQGVGPVTCLADLARPGVWESDQEYEEFLAALYSWRRSDPG